MSDRDKTIKAAKLLASICGGWFGLMSGGLSIPFAFAALFSQGHQKSVFALLAFFALLVFAVRVTWNNYKMLETQKMPLEIESVPCLGERREAHCFVRIKNPSNADATGVEVKLMRITPAPFHPNQKNVPILIQYPIPLSPRHPGGEIIHPLTCSDFLLFVVFQSGFGIFLRLYDGEEKIEFGTEVKNFTPATPFLSDDFDRYTVEMQVSADGRLPTVARFNLSFSTATGKNLFTLSPC
jgi:hypothetical protein